MTDQDPNYTYRLYDLLELQPELECSVRTLRELLPFAVNQLPPWIGSVHAKSADQPSELPDVEYASIARYASVLDAWRKRNGRCAP